MPGAKTNKPKQKQAKGPKVPKLASNSWKRGANKPLTDQQERFAVEYLRDFDRIRALQAAGYKVTSLRNGQSQASYLLSLPNVKVLVAKKKMELARDAGMDAENTLSYMKSVFFEAFSAGDYGGAIRALTEIGRVYGIYEADHSQQRKSPEDVAALRAKLEMLGMDFSRKHFPPHLVGLTPSRATLAALQGKTDPQTTTGADGGTTTDPADVPGPVPGSVGPDGEGPAGRG